MQKYLWKKSGLVVIGMLYLFLAWKGKRMIMVSGQELVEEPQEARKVALTFDDGPCSHPEEKRLPAYVRASRITMRMSLCFASMYLMKFDPIKPAAPVTRYVFIMFVL